MTTTKKQAPVRSTGKPVKEKQTPKAFVNWRIPLNSGGVYAGSKGFPIYQNPKYPNKQEDYLVELAKRHGGSVELDMRISINLYEPTAEPSIDDITVITKDE